MILKRLKIENFRNYGLQELDFDAEVNLVYGNNAQGKSNLLEAICYLGIASSYRNATDSELIRWQQPHFFLQGDALTNSGKLRITAAANRKRQRRWTLNWEAKTRLSDVIGMLHVVMFAPEDVQLVKAGPEARRRFLNQQMSQLDREYCRQLIRYNNILKQRNACLKLGEEADLDQLAVWTEQLLEVGSLISFRRSKLVRELEPRAHELHAGLSGGEKLHMAYLCSGLGKAEEIPQNLEQIKEIFAAELQRLQRAEMFRGLSLAGPHRDDLAVSIDGYQARDFASQGQQRSAALAMKLAELELAAAARKEYPLLLLDDVLSELDEKRRNQIISLIRGKAQTFISATDDSIPLMSGKKWRVEAGRVL